MLTPQSIKDKEFQNKFRGYDPIEVKEYLELLAEDFFELTEQNRQQAEEIESLIAEREALQQEKETLAAEVKISQENSEGIQSEIQDGYKHKDEEIAGLESQIESMLSSTAALEEQNATYQQKIDELEEALAGGQGTSLQEQVEVEKLRGRIEILEEKNRELKQEGMDFKSTILAAQKFADNLRQTSQDDARKMMEDARAEVEKFRTEAEAKLDHLPREIEELNQRKIKVRKELENILYAYLEALEKQPETKEAEEGEDEDVDDLADLFQTIKLPDDEAEDKDEADLDKINLDLS